MATIKKIKDLTQYLGNVGVYELSKGIKRGRKTIKYVVVAAPKIVSGRQIISVWPSNEDGVMDTATTIHSSKGLTIEESLKQFGYELV